MKVLVTGATGLIGCHAIAELCRADDPQHKRKAVRALVRDTEKLAACLRPLGLGLGDVEVVTGDITDPETMRAATEGCDAILHCAGRFSNLRTDAERLWHTNVDGTRTVLETAWQAGLDPIIHVSSYLAMFPPRSELHRTGDPVTEAKELYARTKAAAERIARDLQSRGAPVVTVYPGSVQGPQDPTYGIGSQIIETAIREQRLLVTGGGRCYTDVRDLAQLLDRALQPGLGPRRYMIGGYFLRDEEVLQLLREITGRPIQALRLPGWLLRWMGSAADLISQLTGRGFVLTREAAEVLTRSAPCNDQPAIDELGLSRIGARQSFADLIAWMRASGRLEADMVAAAPDPVADACPPE